MKEKFKDFILVFILARISYTLKFVMSNLLMALKIITKNNVLKIF